MTESPLTPAEASDQQVVRSTVPPNRLESHTPNTAAPEVNAAQKITEELEAPTRPAASSGDASRTAAKPAQSRVSRFANSGLNAHPIKYVGRKDTRANKNVYKLTRASAVQSNSSAPQRKVVEDVDMDELEELLIPANHLQTYRERGSLPIDPRPKMPNYLKYDGVVVTNLGWRPMHNQNARIVRGPIETPREDGIINESSTEQDILVEKLRKHAAVAEERSIQQMNDERELAELVEESEKPLVDEKYFGLENYLKHSGQSEEGRLIGRDESDDPLDAQLSVVAPQVPIPVGRILLGQLDSNKEEAKAGKRKHAHQATILSNKLQPASDASSSRPSILKEAVNSADILDKANAAIQNSTSEPILERAQKFELIEDNSNAVIVGQRAPEKLKVRLRCLDTDGDETFTFQNISHGSIDWSDKSHILSINKWRYDIFRSRGIAAKRVNVFFHPEEEAWLMLFHKKIKLVVEAGHMIKLPGPVPAMEFFNKFFVGKVLQDAEGDDLLPREPRDESSMKSKFQHVNSGFKKMRNVMRKLLEGKKGGVLYLPVITEEEFLLYQTDETVANDDPTEEGKNAAIVDGAERRRSSSKHKRESAVVGDIVEKRIKQ
jgi:hypothetical protein